MTLRPSLLFFSVLLAAFLGFSTAAPLLEAPYRPYRRAFQDYLWLPHKGADFRHLEGAVYQWRGGLPIYRAPGNYFYPPQSLPLIAPFASLGFPGGYYLLVATFVLALGALFVGLFATFCPGSSTYGAVLFLAIVGFSQPSLYLLERGNADGLGAILSLTGLLCLLHRRYGAMAIALAAAAALKPAYLPLGLALFLVPRRARGFFAYGLTHFGLLILSMAVYGSAGLLVEYLTALPHLMDSQRGAFGGMNLSVPSLLAVALNQLRLGDGRVLMNATVSLVVLGGLVALGWTLRARQRGHRTEALGFLLLVTPMWQFRFSTYGAMLLIALLPLADRVYSRRKDFIGRATALGFGVALALVFAPAEFRAPLIGTYRALYLALAFMMWSLFLVPIGGSAHRKPSVRK